MTRQTALDLTDLRYLELTCACGTKVTLDAKRTESHAPGMCPGCNRSFDQIAVSEPVRGFLEFYRMLTHPDQKVGFRVIVEEPSDPREKS